MEQKKFKIKSKNALSSLTESVLSLAKNNSPVAESPRADAVGEITIDQIIESTGGLVTDLQAEDRLYMETVVNGKYEARATTVASIAEFGGELPDLTEYAKLEDLDTATNFTAINPTLDTPAPEVLDKVVTDIENEVKTNTTAITDLTGRVTILENSGGELPDLTEYAKLEDLDTATNFTAINPTLDTPAPEVLDKVVTDIDSEVKTNTTAITDLTGRVTILENSGGGAIVQKQIDVDLQDASFLITDGIVMIDCSTLDSEATTLNLVNAVADGKFSFINVLDTKISIIQYSPTNDDELVTVSNNLTFHSMQIGVTDFISNVSVIITKAFVISMDAIITDATSQNINSPIYLERYSFYLDISKYRKTGNKSDYMKYILKNIHWATDLNFALQTTAKFSLDTLNNGILFIEKNYGNDRYISSLPVFRIAEPSVASANFVLYDLYDQPLLAKMSVNTEYLKSIKNRDKIRVCYLIDGNQLHITTQTIQFYYKNLQQGLSSIPIAQRDVAFNCTSANVKTEVSVISDEIYSITTPAIWGIADIDYKLFE